MVKTMVSCRFSLNPMTGIVEVWTSARNSKRKNLRSAGCIIGEMMNSTPLFPDASEIQVPSTGQRSTSGMVRLREKRLLPVCLFFCFIILNWKGQPAVSLFHHFWQSWCHQTAGSAGLAKDPEPLLCLQPGRVWCSLGFNHYSKKIFHPSCWWFRLALKKHRNLIGGTEILGWVNFIRCRMLDRAASVGWYMMIPFSFGWPGLLGMTYWYYYPEY
jgi:hypothetical protein